MFWDSLTNYLSFTGVKDVTVWQDIALSALVIPIAISLGNKLLTWLNNTRPSKLVFKGCLEKGDELFVFHSQMSGADNDYNFNPNQKYITRYPKPLPTNHANLEIQGKLNIDPVLSEAEAECLTDIYNALGTVGKVENIHMSSLIGDWNIWSSPIISVGFNPKTLKLAEKCDPIHYVLLGEKLGIKGRKTSYSSMLPDDAGVIQKTFVRGVGGVKAPVFILAGLGTVGTSSAGYIFKQHFTKIGKLFGSNPFCVFLKVKIDEGKSTAVIDKICPNPALMRIISHLPTYHEFMRKGYFSIE